MEDPPVTVPWESRPMDAVSLLSGAQVREVTPRYLVAEGVVLLGQQKDLALGLHFDAGGIGRFDCFAPKPERTQTPAYLRHQEALVRYLGAPTWVGAQWEGWGEGPARDHIWEVPGALVLHRLMYRFGFEEHLWILRAGEEVPYGDPRYAQGASD